MKKYLLFSLHIFFISGLYAVKAQELVPEPKRNTIFVELLGNGGIYSLNYDRILISKEKWKLAGRAGVSYFNFFDDFNTQFYAIPLEVSHLLGKGNHFLETGLGFTPLYKTSEGIGEININQETLFLISTARLGYRYQRKDGGFFFKAGWTPQFNKAYRFGNSPFPKNYSYFEPIMGGIGAGYTF